MGLISRRRFVGGALAASVAGIGIAPRRASAAEFSFKFGHDVPATSEVIVFQGVSAAETCAPSAAACCPIAAGDSALDGAVVTPERSDPQAITGRTPRTIVLTANADLLIITSAAPRKNAGLSRPASCRSSRAVPQRSCGGYGS